MLVVAWNELFKATWLFEVAMTVENDVAQSDDGGQRVSYVDVTQRVTYHFLLRTTTIKIFSVSCFSLILLFGCD